jgi:23S rRNA (adenine1618-N6)-methyltransferase
MSEQKNLLHPRNKHRFRYDFPLLIQSLPALRDFVRPNAYGELSVDFAEPAAVMTLNKALLKHFYDITWDIPDGYLCPPIPGRADYIHYLADLLAELNGGKVPKGQQIKGIDIGMGANCVYPIIGHREYGWSFVGSDIDSDAIKSARAIVSANQTLRTALSFRWQQQKQHMFKGIIKPGEYYDFSICNPPFHSSAEEARAGTMRKVKNLGKAKGPVKLNFGGKDAELWYEGGESAFIRNMIMESSEYADQCLWYTTLVSKSQNLPYIYTMLNTGVKAARVRTIEMAQGQKVSRFVAWTFMSPEQQEDWIRRRW